MTFIGRDRIAEAKAGLFYLSALSLAWLVISTTYPLFLDSRFSAMFGHTLTIWEFAVIATPFFVGTAIFFGRYQKYFQQAFDNGLQLRGISWVLRLEDIRRTNDY